MDVIRSLSGWFPHIYYIFSCKVRRLIINKNFRAATSREFPPERNSAVRLWLVARGVSDYCNTINY